jgi:chromate transport protein ChrA
MTISNAVLAVSAVVLVLIAAGRIKISKEDWPSRKARLVLLGIGFAVLLAADALLDSQVAAMIAALVAVVIGIEVVMRRSASRRAPSGGRDGPR